MNIYHSVRKWLQPWWKPKPKGVKKAQPKGEAIEKDVASEVSADKRMDAEAPTVKLFAYSKPLDKAIGFKTLPAVDTVWFYHDDTRHQCFGHFAKGSGFRFTKRDDVQRKKLVARVYPRLDCAYDRTHMIPIGFHGSEKDNRLVVGWSPSDNREKFREFEIKAKDYNKKRGIYWLCSIERTPRGARWSYRIYDDQSMSEVMSLDSELVAPFVWR